MRSVRWGVRADLFFLFSPISQIQIFCIFKNCIFVRGMYKALLILCVFILPTRVISQIIFTRSFTQKLLNVGAVVSLKEDHWFKVALPNPDHLVTYDLSLDNERDSAELKYILWESKKADRMMYPEPYVISTVANLATNEKGYWISTTPISDKLLSERYHADWAAEMSFVPKASITNKKYGKALALYRQDYGMIYTILFYNQEYPGFNNHLRSIHFVASSTH